MYIYIYVGICIYVYISFINNEIVLDNNNKK